jgi:GGDEF domain-containing protein
MPTELLLPAFVLTLLANAALVAMAVRGLVRARAERNRQDRLDRQRNQDRAGPVPTRDATEPLVRPAPRAAAPQTAPPSIPPAPKPAAGDDRAPMLGPAKPPRRTRAAAPKPAPKPADPPKRKRPAAGDGPRSETRRGGRRRFSLPPLDEDHERVNRSIKTFLAGSDGVDAGEARSASSTVATTVAIVAIDGLEPNTSSAEQEGVDDVVATVERTLRGAARSADQITPAGPGRFRVVLPATGELAARAYLRRVRAIVAPSLEAADTPLWLVTATATVLDDTVAVAIAQAESRLDAALAGAARAASDEPRVAHD